MLEFLDMFCFITEFSGVVAPLMRRICQHNSHFVPVIQDLCDRCAGFAGNSEMPASNRGAPSFDSQFVRPICGFPDQMPVFVGNCRSGRPTADDYGQFEIIAANLAFLHSPGIFLCARWDLYIQFWI